VHDPGLIHCGIGVAAAKGATSSRMLWLNRNGIHHRDGRPFYTSAEQCRSLPPFDCTTRMIIWSLSMSPARKPPRHPRRLIVRQRGVSNCQKSRVARELRFCPVERAALQGTSSEGT
jgi:hypothetical protein